MKRELTIEESAKLIELGVDPKLASQKESNFYNGISSEELKVHHLFTIADLLSILPKSYFSVEYYDMMILSIQPFGGQWIVDYRYYVGGEIFAREPEAKAPELIDALYQLLVEMLKRGYVENVNRTNQGGTQPANAAVEDKPRSNSKRQRLEAEMEQREQRILRREAKALPDRKLLEAIYVMTKANTKTNKIQTDEQTY